MKVKLNEERLIYAPKTVIHNNTKYIGGVPDEVLEALGYKDFVQEAAPETEEGYHLESHYEEDESTVTLVYEVVENAPEEKISVLKQMLEETDYQAIKYAEEWISEEEYAEIKAQRQAWRDEINELESVT